MTRFGKFVKKTRGLMSLSAPRRHDVEGDLAEGLVRVRQRHDRFVGGRRGRQDREQRNRAQQPEEADAAGLHRHELAVGRQPAEADQDPEQHAIGIVRLSAWGSSGQQRADDDRPVDALWR